VLPFLLAQRQRPFRVQHHNLILDAVHRLQRLIPAALQLARYQPIGRIDAVVLSARMGSLVVCLGECQIELPPCRRHFSGLSFERLDRSVDAEWL
jgi:hypothetical protein